MLWQIRSSSFFVHFQSIWLRPDGRLLRALPLRFFPDCQKTAAQRRRFGHTLSYIFSAYVVEIVDPGHARSGHHVTSSDLTSQKVWMLVKATPTEWLPWNFQRLISVPVSMKDISRNFYIGDLRSGQFCDLSIVSQWEKNERRLLDENHSKHYETSCYRCRIDTLSRNIVTGDPLSCRQGHIWSWKVTSSFSAITFDRDRLERWKHHRCVQADNMDRLICNMTFSNQVITLTWGQIFQMTF